MNQIQKYEDDLTKTTLTFPTRTDGSEYELSELRQDQLDIILHIMSKFQKWLTYPDRDNIPEDYFIRMIISGKAGSGKSTLVKTLVTLLRRMFQFNNVIQVAAPTGGAANGIGGQTIHRLFACSINKTAKTLSQKEEERLLQSLRSTLALVFDERTMISSKLLAENESHTKHTAHGAKNKNQSWGGIPIVIMVGDEKQLHSIQRGVLSLQFPIDQQDRKKNYRNSTPTKNLDEKMGEDL